MIHKKHIFNESEIELIQFIKFNSPIRIWLEPITYIFEYDTFYIQMLINCAERINLDFPELTERHFLDQYVMVTNLEKISSGFQPNSMSELLSENQSVKEIFIIRTVLCFNKHTQIETNSFNNNSFQINPLAFKDSNDVVTALADVGLSIKFQNETIDCFIVDNDDDFLHNYDSYSYIKNFEEVRQTNCQFIKV